MLAVAAPALAAPGDLDPAFGSFGRVVFNPQEDSTAEDLLIRPDGKLVVIGGESGFGPTVFRFLPDGELDPSFGAQGRVALGAFGTGDGPGSIVRQDDGKLLVVLREGIDPFTVALVRFNADGSYDSSFGDGGIARSNVSLARFPSDVAVDVQDDGDIVVAGPAPCGCPLGAGGGLLVARFLPDGTIDDSFGDGGSTVIPGDEGSWATSVLALPDGRVAAGGTLFGPVNGLRGVATVAVLEDSGAPDPAFSGDGVATANLPYYGQEARDLVEDSRGRILITGGGHSNGFVTRFTGRGRPDRSFGRAGNVIFNGMGTFNALTLLQNGGIVAVGDRNEQFYREQELEVYRRNGELAGAYGVGGVVRTSFGGDAASAAAVDVQSDGKVVTVGTTFKYADNRGGDTEEDLALARFLVDKGASDRDADGFRDPHDGCPTAPARRHDGCPLVGRRVSVHHHNGAFVGRVRSSNAACVRASEVRILEDRRGPDRLVGASSDLHHGEYSVESELRSGRFHAELRAETVSRVGFCEPARSRALEIGGR
jgi:uncharacterized delta-60 repeat protein